MDVHVDTSDPSVSLYSQSKEPPPFLDGDINGLWFVVEVHRRIRRVVMRKELGSLRQ